MFRMTPNSVDKIRVVGEKEAYDYHVFVRVGDKVLDSVNKGHPKDWNVWQQRFQTGTRFTIRNWKFGKAPFNKAFKIEDISSFFINGPTE